MIPTNSVIGGFLFVWCLVPTVVIALWAAAVGVAVIIPTALPQRGGPLTGLGNRGYGDGEGCLSQVPVRVSGDGHVAGGGVLVGGQHLTEVLRHSKHEKRIE